MTDRKRIMVYVTEKDYELISRLADENSCSRSWLLCHLARCHDKKSNKAVKVERKDGITA